MKVDINKPPISNEEIKKVKTKSKRIYFTLCVIVLCFFGLIFLCDQISMGERIVLFVSVSAVVCALFKLLACDPGLDPIEDKLYLSIEKWPESKAVREYCANVAKMNRDLICCEYYAMKDFVKAERKNQAAQLCLDAKKRVLSASEVGS